MKCNLLNEIINLKAHKQMLEVESGTSFHRRQIFSRNQLHEMEEEICRINPAIALRAITRRLREDESEFRRQM